MVFSSFRSGNVDVKIIDGALVVSCLSTGEEKVWRAQMKSLATVAFELRQQRDRTVMIMKHEGGREEEITSFEEHRKAEAALRKVAQALMTPDAPPRGGWLKKTFIVLLLLFIAIFVWTKMDGNDVNAPRSSSMRAVPRTAAPVAPQQESLETAPAPPSVPTGVPVPAEELLGK